MKTLLCILLLATICAAQPVVDCGQCTTFTLGRDGDNRSLFALLKTGLVEVETDSMTYICISPGVPYVCTGSGYGYARALIYGTVDTTFISLWRSSEGRVTMCIGCGDMPLPVEEDSAEVPEPEEEEPNPYLPEVTMECFPDLSGAWVKFDMPEAGMVEIKLFNILGQEVATIARGNFPAGTHRFSLSGSPHSTGTYFVSGSFFEGASVITRKVPFVK